jgi:UDP-glucose:(heptosyl)LPS alpha-1,3-glucosyltransferase
MRIAVLSRNFSPACGGAERYSVALAKELSKHHEIHVYCQETNFPVSGITYHHVLRIHKRPRWLNQWLFSSLTWLLTRNQFDIVHSHEHVWHGNVHTLHVRCVWASIFEDRHRWKLALRWLQVFTSLRHITYLWLESARIRDKANHGLVFVSDKLRDEFTIHYSDIASRSIVVTPGVYLPDSLKPRDESRHKLNWADNQIYLLFVANDYERKGLSVLLKALKKLKSSIMLAVVGQSKQLTKFEMQVKQLGLTDRVQFYGQQEDLSTFYRAADLLVHPTLEDSFGMIILEAMAQELPVLVSAFPYCGLAYQFSEGVHAKLIADPLNAEQLADLIQNLLNDPPLQKILITNGLEIARSATWEDVALKYENYFLRIAKAKEAKK